MKAMKINEIGFNIISHYFDMETVGEMMNKPVSYLYFITDGKYTKIGKANNVKARLGELQVANPNELKVVFSIRCLKSTVEMLELAFHQYYSEKRIRGEWFDLDMDFEIGFFKDPRFLNIPNFCIVWKLEEAC